MRLEGDNSIKGPICPHYLASIPTPRDMEEKDCFSKLVPICGLLGRPLGLHVDIRLHVMGVYFLIYCCHKKTVVVLLRSLQLAVMYVKVEQHFSPELSCLHLSPLLAHVIIFEIPMLLQRMTSTPVPKSPQAVFLPSEQNEDVISHPVSALMNNKPLQ